MRRSSGGARAVVRFLAIVFVLFIVALNSLTVFIFHSSYSRGAIQSNTPIPTPGRLATSPYNPRPPKLTEDAPKMAQIKEAFQFAWGSYKRFAWGHDFLRPLAKAGENVFSGGLTICDSLDTILIMGFDDEFQRSKAWIQENFTLRGDYSVFEIVIRIVGGFLSVYQISNDAFFLQKAHEIGIALLPLFNTPTGYFRTYVRFEGGAKAGEVRAVADGAVEVLLSDIGSVQLEFYTLSLLTGDMRFAEAGAKIHRTLFAMFPNDGLYPERLNSHSGGTHKDVRSLDSMSDSFYEYLIKIWLMTKDTLDVMLQRYLRMAKAVEQQLIRRTTELGWTWLARVGWGADPNQMSHLATFSAGMLALGAVEKNPRAVEDLQLADELVTSFMKMYNAHAAGFMPECTQFTGESYVLCDGRYRLRPETIESLFVLYRMTGLQKYRDYAWTIFERIETKCKVEGGYATIWNVDDNPPSHEDMMDSYFLAETLKYLYLTFCSSDVISIEEWIFNTEAHPFRVWTEQQAESMKPYIRLE
jgi:mannosyl-oligosaccharide alpha-1,2-mannosidase